MLFFLLFIFMFLISPQLAEICRKSVCSVWNTHIHTHTEISLADHSHNQLMFVISLAESQPWHRLLALTLKPLISYAKLSGTTHCRCFEKITVIAHKADSQFYFKFADRKTCNEIPDYSIALPGPVPVAWLWPSTTSPARGQSSTWTATSCSGPTAERESTERGWRWWWWFACRKGSLHIGRNHHGKATGHCVRQVACDCHGSWSLPDPVATTSTFPQVPSVLQEIGALDRPVLARELPLYLVKCS